MHKRTRACEIKPDVKKAVERRDGGMCIFCHHAGRGEAHFIPRSQGGLGVEENLLTVCRICHYRMDNTQARNLMLRVAETYLREKYPDWDREKLIYRKWSLLGR